LTIGNIGNHLPFYAAQHPGRAKTYTSPRRNPAISHIIAVLHVCKTGYFTLRLTVLLNRELTFMFRPVREVAAVSRIWHEEEVENFTFHTKTLE